MQNFNSKANKYIHKYGFIIHFSLFLYILYIANIHPNSLIYYIFVLNLIAMLYFNTVQSIAFGITKTTQLLEENTKEDERNKLN